MNEASLQVAALHSLIEGVSGPMALASTRASIERLEDEFRKHPQVDIPVIHRYAGGIYAREITIPAGTILTGRIYKEDHFDVMVSGDITVSSDDGRKRMEGFNIFPGVRGKKRAGIAHEDTRWITFCSSPEMLEDDYLDYHTVLSFDDLDKDDFLAALSELGVSEQTVREQSENVGDQEYPVDIQRSTIEGVGLFAAKDFSPDETIMPARIGNTRTIAGRYTNHSGTPNAYMDLRGGGVSLVAKNTINLKDEITVDYRMAKNLQEIK
jgi:hypothetical protein|tara:strand:- start:2737 stop:3537 length:801 start_codon:yes stop_codon:yes gene_type:complete